MIKILVDSSSELTKKEAEEKGFLFVPISVNIGGREYRDGVDLTKDKFYDLLVNGGEFPQTSQPSPRPFWNCLSRRRRMGMRLWRFSCRPL